MTVTQTGEATLIKSIDPTLLDSDRRVAADVDCFQCGYNLRTLPATGVCPECAGAVADSLRRPELYRASAVWLSGLLHGVRCLLFALLQLAITAAAAVVVRFAMPAVGLAGLAGLGAVMFTLVGVACLTAPERHRHGQLEREHWRQAARWSPPATCGLALVTVCIVGIFLPARVSLPVSVPFAATVFLGLVVSPFAVLRYLAILLRRTREAALARLAGHAAVALLTLGIMNFLHALLPLFTGIQALHQFRDLRLIVVGLTGLGYLVCGLLSTYVLLRSRHVFSQALAASESRRVRSD